MIKYIFDSYLHLQKKGTIISMISAAVTLYLHFIALIIKISPKRFRWTTRHL